MRTVITKDTRVVAETLASGEVACVPTETVYGLGANALNEKAVVKIYETKDRPRFNPIIVHISRKEEFEKYGKNIPDKVYRLAEKFSPGPITFVVSKNDVIPDIVTAGNDSVGLRIPKHPLFMELLT
ncbi:MAG: Sua5/YciO/YrdC/YwlC family protein, partial [Ignavibacteria bacterium]